MLAIILTIFKSKKREKLLSELIIEYIKENQNETRFTVVLGLKQRFGITMDIGNKAVDMWAFNQYDWFKQFD